MSNKTFRHILAALALIALAMPVFASPVPIICTPGNKWEYDRWKLLNASIEVGGKTLATMHDASAGSSVYEVLSQEAGSSPVVYNYRETQNTKSTNGSALDTTSDMRITCGDDGLRVLSITEDSSTEKEPDKQTYDPPLFYFNAAAVSGKSWEVGMMKSGDIKSFVNAKGAGRETVTVPAGTFKDCLKVIYSSDDISGTIDMWGKSFTINSGKRRGIYWIADGVGVVKEMEVVTSGAESTGPDGKPVQMNTALCSIGELKPGYIVKK
ncbi:MAG: hypothetical protein ABFD49_11335 [Armatimonadota bacterium]|nr:hypothetical protein [bacterium]